MERHAQQVDSAYQKVEARNHLDFVSGRLPKGSFCVRISHLEHNQDDWRKLPPPWWSSVAPALRVAFPGAGPQNEKELQREIDVAQTAAKARLSREFPSVTYGQVGTRPDFSGSTTADDAREPDLFVEVKLIRRKAEVVKVIDQINADIPKYVARGRTALFLVYDSGGFVIDDRDFSERIQAGGPVMLAVLR